MKKKILIILILTATSVFYYVKLKNEIDIYVDDSRSVYLSKFLAFDKKKCGDTKLHDKKFKALLLDACRVTSEVQFDEYRKKALDFIKSNDFKTAYFWSEAYSPMYGDKIKSFQEMFQKDILTSLKDEFERSLIVKNFTSINCEKKHLQDVWSFLNQTPNAYLVYPTLSEVKECHFMGKVEKKDFLKNGIELLESKRDGDVFVKSFSKNLAKKTRLRKEIILLLLHNNDFFRQLLKNEELMFLDELSQFYYLDNNYIKVKNTLEHYLKIYSNEFKLTYMDIQKNIVFARLGKALLKLGQDDEAKAVLKELAKSQQVLNQLSKMHYPDFSLAGLMIEKGYRIEVKNYLTELNADDILEESLYKKWISEIENGVKPEFELEIFRLRYEARKETGRYQMEESQIILFKDSIKN